MQIKLPRGEAAMPDDSYRTIRTLLASTKPEKLREGLKLAELEVAKVGSSEARPLFEMVSTLFYIDTLDHPELVPILDEAINLTVRFGAWVIPILVDNLDEGDLKAQWATAHVLGRIGTAAIAPLLTEYESAANPTLRAFILYALGKVKVPGIVQASPAALEAARSPNLELRDTATRALGKFVESIPQASLSEKMKRRFIECLRGNLSDTNASVRAKAIRSLGKMAKHGHLTESERMQLKAVCRRITGTDENNEWDRAYVVRKEAAEALTYLE
jgi:HEAT repeat protein